MLTMVASLSLVAAAFVSTALAAPTTARPEILWDGRIPKNFDVAGFDDPAVSPFNVGWNHGKSTLPRPCLLPLE